MTDKPQWTPGPWVVGEIDQFGGYDMMTAGVQVGPVHLDAMDYGQGRCTYALEDDIKQKMLADAYLIAAAPEMAEALRPFADFFDFMLLETEGFQDKDEFQMMFGDHTMQTFKVSDFRSAHAALAKARGVTE